MASTHKSPAQVLELPEGASLQAIEAAYTRGLGLLDAQSMAAYGMFDAQSADRLRSELKAAYQALTDAAPKTQVAPAENQPQPAQVAAARPEAPTGLEPAPKPQQAPAVSAHAEPAAGTSAATFAAPNSAPPPGAAHAVAPGADIVLQHPPAAAAAQSPPPRAVPTMGLGQDALRVRLCAPRTDPLAEPLTGAVLKQLREALGANVDDVCEVTKINRRYIVALEEEDYSLLPATVYVRGFVSEYARVLGLQTQATAPYVEAYVRWCSAHS